MKIFYKYALLLALICFAIAGNAQNKLSSEREFPILAWIGVPEQETTIERFLELKEIGININYSGYSNIGAVEKALKVAQQTGIKLLPSFPELKSDPEASARRLMKHPALYGYHLRDEPSATDFPELGVWMRRLEAVDKKHPSYINLFPNYASTEQLFGKDFQPETGKDIFEQHLEAFLKEVPAPFISFDHYPVIETNDSRSLRPLWYKNLEIVAKVAQKNKLPFWAFALSVAHAPYPIPTVAEIRLQQFSNLAYGAQVLQYFTFWTPGVNSSWDFHHAPIGLDGRRTAVYDRVKQVNKEIQGLAGVFLGAKVLSISHTGKQVPAGTRRLDKLPEQVRVLETSDGGAIVSVLEKNKRRFLVIVNRDFLNPMKLTTVTDDTVQRVQKDGTLVKANAYEPTLEVDPGDIVVYTWQIK